MFARTYRSTAEAFRDAHYASALERPRPRIRSALAFVLGTAMVFGVPLLFAYWR